MRFKARYVLSVLALFAAAILVFGQQTPVAPAQSNPSVAQQQGREQKQTQVPEGNRSTPRETVMSELAKTSREAAGEEEENAQFKHSPSVRFIARITGLSLQSAYWLSIALNFAILAVLIIMFSKSKLPAMFRTRTGEIQRGITEARKASEQANRRLQDIEARLAKLDTDVAAMRVMAEKEAALEEARISQAADEEKNRIVERAESEIAMAAKLARRELKVYAADLAVSLAEKRIQVNADTDRALVSNFVAQLTESGAPGKDGH